MNTGHDGSMTTVHANSPRDSLARIETMVLMAGIELPVRAIREQIAAAVDLIIHQTRLKDGSRRITHVTEVVGLGSDGIELQDLFLFDFRAGLDTYGRYRGQLQPTGQRPTFMDRLADSGVIIPPEVFAPAPAGARTGGNLYGHPVAHGAPGDAPAGLSPPTAPGPDDAMPSWMRGGEPR
jgi:pilus assembly protein CpaF